MAVVPIEHFRIECRDFSMPRIQLRDRRTPNRPVLQWIFQRHLERVLYGRDDGGIWKILNQTGLGRSSLHISKNTVEANELSQAEFDAVLTCFKQSLSSVDPSSVGRIRSCTILPLAVAATVARTFGRSEASTAFLTAFAQPVPQGWQLQAQQEAHAAVNEQDLLLDEQLEDQGLEVEDLTFAEELTQMAKFSPDAEDEGKMRQYAINPVPAPLKTSMAQYVASRTAVFAARREGGAAASTTAEADVQSLYRFFGWMHRTNRVPQGAFLWLSFLERADLGDLAQQYAEWLRENQQLRFSSIANYLNGLASIVAYFYANHELPPETVALDPSPLTQILNLRGQAEKASRTQNLYDKRVGGWLTWGEVQQSRVKALERLAGCNAANQRTYLREAAAISLLSLIPPDRVGIIRKLRMGHTLKRIDGGGWRLDLTNIRDAHKTSRFYGPFAAKLPSALDSVLDRYTALLGFEFGGDEAYLFHPPTGAIDRPMESSNWTSFVRRLFKKLHGTEIAPKTLRSVFVTWLRENTDCPQILKSAAHAMKHRS